LLAAKDGDLVKPWDDKGYKMPGGAPYHPAGFMTFVGANAMVHGKTMGVYPAAKALLAAVYEGALVPFDAALRIEARHFTGVLMNPSSSAMIRSLFINKEALEKGANRPEAPDQTVKKVGVIGAGMMGAGIAYVSAMAGIEVVLIDAAQDAADRGKAYSEGLLDKALQRKKTSIKDWSACSYSPEVEDEDVTADPGLDFFTWLWFAAETRGGLFKLDQLGDWGVMIEGPLTFVREGAGAHETVVRRGEPLVSAEAKAALVSGKKLRRAKLTLARGDLAFSCTFEAPAFVVRSLKLPEGEKLDALSKFQERMTFVDLFKEALLSLFDRFVEERLDAKKWKATRTEIHTWVTERKTRG